MALVIREWTVEDRDGTADDLIRIVGREEGLLNWLLTLLGIDAATTLRITRTSAYFEQGSLGGFVQRVIPIRNISSGYFGYTKPWREALLLTALLLPVFGLGLIVGPVYYFLNKRLSIGVVENSGVINGIEFKRSVIEGKRLDEAEAKQVIEVIRQLIDDSTVAT